MASMADTGREMRNAAITVEVPGLGPCDFREFSWAENFKVWDILAEMGITDPDVDWEAFVSGDDPKANQNNMRRMFATATVAIQMTHPEATFEQVAALFKPFDAEDDRLLSRIYGITATGKDVTEDDADAQPAAGGNGNGA